MRNPIKKSFEIIAAAAFAAASTPLAAQRLLAGRHISGKVDAASFAAGGIHFISPQA